jgi:hypothetical protein
VPPIVQQVDLETSAFIPEVNKAHLHEQRIFAARHCATQDRGDHIER